MYEYLIYVMRKRKLFEGSHPFGEWKKKQKIGSIVIEKYRLGERDKIETSHGEDRN